MLEPSIKSNSARIPYWDNLKFILIAAVVFGHYMYLLRASNQYLMDFYLIIYTFHMPAFVFVSGYFSKSDNSKSAESIVKLLCAYLLFNGFFMVRAYCLGNTVSFLTPYVSYWYLLSLICWRLSVRYFAKMKHGFAVVLFLAIFCGFCSDITNLLSIRRTLAFYPFFYMGYVLKPEQADHVIKMKPSKKLLWGSLVLALGLAAAAAGCKFLKYTGNQLMMSKYGSCKDILIRLAIYATAVMITLGLMLLVPNKRIPIVTNIGKNSLSVFLIHRPLIIYCVNMMKQWTKSGKILLLLSVAETIFMLLILGSEFAAKMTQWVLKGSASFLLPSLRKETTGKKKKAAYLLSIIPIVVIFALVISSPIKQLKAKESQNTGSGNSSSSASSEEKSTAVSYKKMAADQKASYDNAFRILFAGDLMLLEDQVKLGKTSNGYDFSKMFSYTSSIIQDADIAIGVFEGPTAGEDSGYSTSNYGDGKKLASNFPDAFASAVKDAGFDLVTLANNHILDRGKNGELRTLEVLDNIGLAHTGAYSSAKDKEENRVCLIEKDGIRIAVLSYTFKCNGYSAEEMASKEYSWVTSLLVDPSDENFKTVKKSVKADFEKAKSCKPDLIIVLPHMGKDFSESASSYQKTWCQIFYEYGADMILCDHSHSVQPVEISKDKYGFNRLTVYCPGNFASVFTGKNTDASALVEAYIDRETKEIIGCSVLPLWTYAENNENYKAVPIYNLVTDHGLRQSLSSADLGRISTLQSKITRVMLGKEFTVDNPQLRYYVDEKAVYRIPTEPMEISDFMKNGPFWKAFSDAESVCFVGDGVSSGSKNGNYPWFEPFLDYAKGKTTNKSWAEYGTEQILGKLKTIAKVDADLFVVAAGANDIRYQSKSKGALTAEAYIENMHELRDGIVSSQPDAKFVWIAPWTSLDYDDNSKLSYKEKISQNNEYTAALKAFAEEQGDVFIDPNPEIIKTLETGSESDYLIDAIHPNGYRGVYLYSRAVLNYQ